MEELRSFFSGTAGSLAFNGTKIKKRYKTLIKIQKNITKELVSKTLIKAVQLFREITPI